MSHEGFRRLYKAIFQIAPPHRKPKDRETLAGILRKPWFNRRWVVQEVQAFWPGKVRMLMGSATCSGQAFHRMLSTYNMWDRATPIRCPPSESNLILNLYFYDKMECSDPRDRVFAIVNLSADGSLVSINYNQDVRDTYLSFVKALVFNESEENTIMRDFSHGQDSLSISPTSKIYQMLALASCKKNLTVELPLEAWVPDWRVETQFESEIHRDAVESLVLPRWSNSNLNHIPVQGRIDMDRDGYNYLYMVGTVLKLDAAAESTRITVDSEASENMKAFQILAAECDRYWPKPRDKSGCLWLPDIKLGTSIQFLRGLPVFGLKAGIRSSTFQGISVYRLHSCFMLQDHATHSFSRLCRTFTAQQELNVPRLCQMSFHHGIYLE